MNPSRLPPPDADALAHSARVRAHLDAVLRAQGGWMDFAQYMDLVLHAPGLGYYAAGATKFGPQGDFTTAPQLSALFGQALARQLAPVLAATGGDLLELGAGTGVLAVDLLQALAQAGPLPGRYLVLETSAALAARQREAVAALPPALRERVHWIAQLPQGFCGAILANEVLDAVPVRLVRWNADGSLDERGVAGDGAALRWAERPLEDAGLVAAARQIAPPPPYLSELAPQAAALVRSLARCLHQGLLLFIDYGFGQREYYHPQRAEGTLMCHYRHHAHADPFHLPGLQDITAHVDFTAMALAGVGEGLALLGYTTQAHFLVNLGILDLLQAGAGEAPARHLPRAAAVQRLLSPAEMGELFKVLALGRGLAGPLAGFASGDLRRLL